VPTIGGASYRVGELYANYRAKSRIGNTLKTMAEQEHISINEIINRLLGLSLKEKQISPDEENRQQLLKKLRTHSL
jgi:hypothetical protein